MFVDLPLSLESFDDVTVVGLTDPILLEDDRELTPKTRECFKNGFITTDLQHILHNNPSVMKSIVQKLKTFELLPAFPSGSILDNLLPGYLMFASTSCADSADDDAFDTCDRLRLCKAAILTNQPNLTGYMPPPYPKTSLQLLSLPRPTNPSDSPLLMDTQAFLAGKFTFPVVLEQCVAHLIMQVCDKGDLTLPLSSDVV
jgi:hypothetical protein